MEPDSSTKSAPSRSNQSSLLREADNGQGLRSLYVKEKDVFYLILLAIVFIIIGCIPLMIPVTKSLITEHKLDYTNCERLSFTDISKPKSCREYVQRTNNTDCLCIEIFNITSPLQGQVTIYFDLPALDQIPDINSRDNDQLRGILSKTPSESCEPYRYDNGIPIVPCGALADSMFTDNITDFYLRKYNHEGQSINFSSYGMLSAEDRVGFYNPEDLENALKNFSKPKSWNKPISELDESYPENNGFQNERFISWMRTDWKRKHVARIGDAEFIDGLPAGSYQITIHYIYPPLKYNGQRSLIFVAEKQNSDYYTAVRQQYVASVVLLCIEILILVVIAVYWKKYSEKRNRDKYSEVSQNYGRRGDH